MPRNESFHLCPAQPNHNIDFIKVGKWSNQVDPIALCIYDEDSCEVIDLVLPSSPYDSKCTLVAKVNVL
jgi:hypothetical protein